MLGRVEWDQDEFSTPVPAPDPGAEVESMIPAPPGRIFVAGRVGIDDRVDDSAYLPQTLGPPRDIEVRAGEIADICDGRPLVFEPE